MTIQIGRIGLTTALGGDGHTIYEPYEINQQGQAVTLRGMHQESTLINLLWFRDQILDLSGAGSEPVIPVRFANYPSLNGFYRVVSSEANRTSNGLDWSVNLTRIADWSNPKVEIQTLYGLVTNGHGVTVGDLLIGRPGTVSSFLTGMGGASSTTRFNADAVLPKVDYYNGLAAPSSFVTKLQILPDYWYQAGCRAEYNLNSAGTYLTVIGRHPFAAPADTNLLRVSNGAVRFTGGAGSGWIDVSWWDGSTWDPITTFTIDDTAQGAVSLNSAVVLRNTPEEVVVRYTGSVAGVGPVFIDLAVRRGSRNVIGYASSYGGSIWRVQFNTSTSTTGITGGLRRTANNGGGNRELLVSNTGTTISNATGKIAQPSSLGPFLFAIGAEVGGSAATGIDAAATQSAEFFMSIAETSMVVAL